MLCDCSAAQRWTDAAIAPLHFGARRQPLTVSRAAASSDCASLLEAVRDPIAWAPLSDEAIGRRAQPAPEQNARYRARSRRRGQRLGVALTPTAIRSRSCHNENCTLTSPFEALRSLRCENLPAWHAVCRSRAVGGRVADEGDQEGMLNAEGSSKRADEPGEPSRSRRRDHDDLGYRDGRSAKIRLKSQLGSAPRKQPPTSRFRTARVRLEMRGRTSVSRSGIRRPARALGTFATTAATTSTWVSFSVAPLTTRFT
jgi:hypothetical protein